MLPITLAVNKRPRSVVTRVWGLREHSGGQLSKHSYRKAVFTSLDLGEMELQVAESGNLDVPGANRWVLGYQEGCCLQMGS